MADIDKMIEGLQGQLEILTSQRAKIDQQIAAIKQSLHGLLLYKRSTSENSDLASQLISQFLTTPNLGEACRDAVNALGRRVTPVEVRDQLSRMGFDFGNYSSNPLSSIHTTLKRLADNGRIRAIRDINTRKIVAYESLFAAQ